MARQAAKHCSVYYNGTKVADGYDFSWDFSRKFEDGSAWGDNSELPESAGPTAYKASVKRKNTTGAVTPLAQVLQDPDTIYRIIAYMVEGTPSSKCFEMDMKIESGSLTASRGSLRDEGVSFIGYGDPVFGG